MSTVQSVKDLNRTKKYRKDEFVVSAVSAKGETFIFSYPQTSASLNSDSAFKFSLQTQIVRLLSL
jgi:hypothetical protein